MRAADQQYGQPGGVRHKYAGMEGDDATGMSHTLWRVYDPLSSMLSESSYCLRNNLCEAAV